MSQDKKLFAISALFDSPDAIMAAAEKVSERNYKHWDVNTPYPVHGMDDAMKIPPSKLAWVTFALSAFGASFAMFFMWWVMDMDYPLNVGGKPFFSIPAFVPITFAVGVLLSVTTTVFSLIVFFCKLPGQAHPMHDTEYMKACISNKFGIIIESKNEGFEAAEVEGFLSSIGASKIIPIYEPDFSKNEIPLPFGARFTYKEIFFVLILLGTVGAVVSKVYVAYNQVLYDQLPILHTKDPITGLQLVYFTDTLNGKDDGEEQLKFLQAGDTAKGIIRPIRGPFTWLDTQPKEGQTSRSKFFADSRVLREQVPETVAQGYKPYVYVGDPMAAAEALVNPVPLNETTLAEGRKQFNISCSVCHGYFGDGDGRLNGQFPTPPSLHGKRIAEGSDGLIYHIITNGQNKMPAYDKQIDRETRWKVVHYIRSLQRARDAKESDLK